ncbi:MAG: lipoyl synthase [Blastocatellia bacterium]|nr:lipoyl synthase [Blastocatellia bacterium]
MRIANNENFADVLGMVGDLSLNTVCQEARCPNIWECWSERTATFMLMGDICTRYCGFCSVGKGAPGSLDSQEPRHVAEAIRKLGCRHAVITSVNRDDLPDGGGSHFAETIRQVRALNPGTAVEVLIPDFQGKDDALDTVLAARPDVLSHNTETVPRLYTKVRPDAIYEQTLHVLARAAAARSEEYPVVTKSGLMLGLGETRDEVIATLEDLRAADCDFVTMGQYLSPSPAHLPIKRYLSPEEFDDLGAAAKALGFRYVESGPLVRSSYHAAKPFQK